MKVYDLMSNQKSVILGKVSLTSVQVLSFPCAILLFPIAFKMYKTLVEFGCSLQIPSDQKVYGVFL